MSSAFNANTLLRVQIDLGLPKNTATVWLKGNHYGLAGGFCHFSFAGVVIDGIVASATHHQSVTDLSVQTEVKLTDVALEVP